MKMNKTGARWLRQNGACDEGREWALAECATLAEVWATARPDWLIWVATREGVLNDRTLWLFACWCAERAIPHWVAAYPDDRRPQIAIETRRRWIDGQAANEELDAARAAAEVAARDAARAAARDAAWDAARAAARDAAVAAAWAAAREAAEVAREAAEVAAEVAARAAAEVAARAAAEVAARDAARAAARDAAWAAARAAARDAAREAQAKWLRSNAIPVFPDAQTTPDLTTSPKTIISGEVSPTDAAAALPRHRGDGREDGGL